MQESGASGQPSLWMVPVRGWETQVQVRGQPSLCSSPSRGAGSQVQVSTGSGISGATACSCPPVSSCVSGAGDAVSGAGDASGVVSGVEVTGSLATVNSLSAVS